MVSRLLVITPRIATWTGGLLWMMAYASAFVAGQQAGTPAFPVPAIMLNLTWEFLFGVLRPPANSISRLIYLCWFAIDGLLWLQLFWLGAPRELGWLSEVDYQLFLVIGTACAVWIHRRLNQRLRAPHLQAYLANLVTSGAFVWVALARTDHAALTMDVAWLKFIGTTLITLANVQHFWRLRSAPTLALLCMVSVGLLDVSYLVLLQLR